MPNGKRQQGNQGVQERRTYLNQFFAHIERGTFTSDEVFSILRDLAEELSKQKYSPTRTQMRNLFNQFRAIENQAKASKGMTEGVRVGIRMIEARVKYLEGREKAPRYLYELVSRCVKKILSSQDQTKEFGDFMKFLEAFYAYYYAFGRN